MTIRQTKEGALHLTIEIALLMLGSGFHCENLGKALLSKQALEFVAPKMKQLKGNSKNMMPPRISPSNSKR